MDFPIVLTDFENISLLPTDGLPSEVYDVLTYTSIPFVLLFFRILLMHATAKARA